MSGTSENVKKAVHGHFTQKEIKEAKETVYEKCKDKYNIRASQVRRDSSIRSENEANVKDIISIMSDLDKESKPPIFAIPAASLRNIPRSHPVELNSISVIDRIVTIEDKEKQREQELDQLS